MISISLTILGLTLIICVYSTIFVDGVRFNDSNIPIRLIFFIYTVFMFLTPLYWHLNEEYILFSNDLEDYIPMTIFFYSVGIAFFTIFYLFCKSKYKSKKKNSNYNFFDYNKSIFQIVFILNLLIVITWSQVSGYTVSALFLVNFLAEKTVTYDINVTSGPLSLFIESLIVSTSLVILHPKCSKIFKIIAFSIVMLIFISLGFRYRMILLCLILVFSYLSINRFDKKIVRKALIYVLISVTLLISLSYFRNYIKQINRGVDIELVESNEPALDKLFSNTRNFYSFTSLVKYIDKGKGEFDYGETMFLNIFYRFVPSSFFENDIKPRPIGVEQSANSWGTMEGYYAGEAYSHFGEYYQAYGFSGIIVFMSIFGCIVAVISVRISSSKNYFTISKFSLIVLSASFFQMITRGYLPQYILILIYLMLPILFVRILLGVRRHL